MKLAFDLMGGDFAPLQAVKGLQLYLTEQADPAQVVCTGDASIIRPLFEEYQIPSTDVTLISTSQQISYKEHPTKAFKEKPDSSLVKGFTLLASNEADAFVSAGNTGAMLVGAMFSVKPVPGVQRPTIATLMPKTDGGIGLLVDVGLNADCKPQQLNQFAMLGKIYAQCILEKESPAIGLLNIGEEEGKGNALAQATYPLLKENDSLNFIGNVEGRDILSSKVDVIVCDGFTGNIVLKMVESLYDMAVVRHLQNDELMQRFHYENYGGTPILGIHKPVLIGHGISNARAFCNMLMLAEKMVRTGTCNKMAAAFSHIILLKTRESFQ
jgi:glycerol-3-phosphate acyltransferase PlsX